MEITLLATDPAVLRSERVSLVLLAVGLPLIFALLVWLARLRDRIPSVPTTLTEPPEDLHPVDLAILWSAYRKHLSPRTAYRAEILHLARIRAIRLDPVGTVSEPVDFRLTLGERPTEQVDRDFLRFMFPDQSSGVRSVTLHQLRLGTGGRSRLAKWWSDAYARVESGVQRIWLSTRIELLVAFVLGVWGPGLALGVIAPHFTENAGWAGIAVGVGWVSWLITAWALPARLSGPLRRQAASWEAFRRYLKRFPSLSGSPAAGIALWGAYLPLAVALGLARRVERQVRALDPRSLPPPWERAPDGLVGLTWFRRLWRRSPTHLPPALRPTTHELART
jgi:Predicted membrane protein (DUF2207) C-terminal domain